MTVSPQPDTHTGLFGSLRSNTPKPFPLQTFCICWFLCLEMSFLSVSPPLQWHHTIHTHTHTHTHTRTHTHTPPAPSPPFLMAGSLSLFILQLKNHLLKKDLPPSYLKESLQSLYDVNLFYFFYRIYHSLKLSPKSNYLYIICFFLLECRLFESSHLEYLVHHCISSSWNSTQYKSWIW